MTTNELADRRRMSALAIGAMMRPRSVAIIGMSAKAGSAGRIVLELLTNNKFQGPIHLVGRSGADIEGRKVLASIDELPEGVDLAVFTLPAAARARSGRRLRAAQGHDRGDLRVRVR